MAADAVGEIVFRIIGKIVLELSFVPSLPGYWMVGAKNIYARCVSGWSVEGSKKRRLGELVWALYCCGCVYSVCAKNLLVLFALCEK